MEGTVAFSVVSSEATMEVFSMGPIPGSDSTGLIPGYISLDSVKLVQFRDVRQ
jgi:hypothetical protein